MRERNRIQTYNKQKRECISSGLFSGMIPDNLSATPKWRHVRYVTQRYMLMAIWSHSFNAIFNCRPSTYVSNVLSYYSSIWFLTTNWHIQLYNCTVYPVYIRTAAESQIICNDPSFLSFGYVRNQSSYKSELDVLCTQRAQFICNLFLSIFQNYFLYDKTKNFYDSDNQ